MLSWVKETIDDNRIIGAESLTYVYTGIGADHAFHSDMISHTGGDISMGHGVLHEKLSVQRLNTKISMEAELVGVSEHLTYNLWLMIFLHGQGYRKMKNVVYYDLQSMINVQVFFRVLQEARAHKNPTKHRQSEQT